MRCMIHPAFKEQTAKLFRFVNYRKCKNQRNISQITVIKPKIEETTNDFAQRNISQIDVSMESTKYFAPFCFATFRFTNYHKPILIH